MTDTNSSKRSELIRNTVVFQLKLVADGFRDLVLLPISLVATIIGLLRGGDEPGREFKQVIDLGRQSEQWINLFGNHEHPEDASPTASIDVLFTKVEETLKQHYQSAGTSKSAQAEIDEALQAVHEKATERQAGKNYQ